MTFFSQRLSWTLQQVDERTEHVVERLHDNHYRHFNNTQIKNTFGVHIPDNSKVKQSAPSSVLRRLANTHLQYLMDLSSAIKHYIYFKSSQFTLQR